MVSEIVCVREITGNYSIPVSEFNFKNMSLNPASLLCMLAGRLI